MTRKDYELIANSLSIVNDIYGDEIDNNTYKLIVNSLAMKLEAANPRFDKDRFRRAVGLVID